MKVSLTPLFYIVGFVLCLVIFNGKLNLSYPAITDTATEESGRYDLVFMHQSTLDVMMDRDVNDFSVEQRKKFRWLYKYFEVKFFYHLLNFSDNPKIGKYLVLFHYSIIMFLSLLLSVKIFEHILTKERKDTVLSKKFLPLAYLSFFSLYSFVLLISPLDEYFSFIEVFAIFLAVYSSMKQKHFLFFISIVVGVSNRESGLIIGMIYVLLNYHNMKIRDMILYVVSPAIIFSMINYDIIGNFYQLIFYTPTLGDRTSLFNYIGLWQKSTGELINYIFVYASYLIPISYFLVKLRSSELLRWSKLLILMYLFVILFGSFIGNFILLLLLIPFYQILIALYLDEIFTV